MNHTSQTDFQASPISNIQLPEKNPEEKEEKTKEDINYCKETFEAFVNKHKENIPKCFNFNKILNFVKVPFTSLPSLIQIKGFFHNYLLREKKRKYLKKGLWNEKELKILLWCLIFFGESIKKKIDDFSNEDWLEIASIFPNTTALKCKSKWHSIKKSKFMKKKWCHDEDKMLSELMQKRLENAKISWNEIAEAINSAFYNHEFVRTGRHCRDRWVHHLNPKLSKAHWLVEEDLQIMEYVLSNGKKWANLSKIMNNRNEDSIRNRFIKLFKSFKSKEKEEKIKKNGSFYEEQMVKKIIAELKKSLEPEEKSQQDTITILGKRNFNEFNEAQAMNVPKVKQEQNEIINIENLVVKRQITEKKESQNDISETETCEIKKETSILNTQENLLEQKHSSNKMIGLQPEELNNSNFNNGSHSSNQQDNNLSLNANFNYNSLLQPNPFAMSLAQNMALNQNFFQRSLMENMFYSQASFPNQYFYEWMMIQRMKMMLMPQPIFKSMDSFGSFYDKNMINSKKTNEFNDEKMFTEHYFINETYFKNSKKNVNKVNFKQNTVFFETQRKTSESPKEAKLLSFSHSKLVPSKIKADSCKKGLLEYGKGLINEFSSQNAEKTFNKRLLKKAMLFLKNYTETLDCQFTEIFYCVIEILKDFIFLKKKQKNEQISSVLIDKLHDSKLKRYLLYSEFSLYPYKKVFESFLKELNAQIILSEAMKQDNEQTISKMRASFNEKMQAMLESQTKHNSLNNPNYSAEINDLKKQIDSLNQKINESENFISNLLQEDKKKSQELLDSHANNKLLEAENKELSEKNKKSLEEISKLKQNLSLSSDNQKQLKKTLENLKDLNERILIKLNSLKQEHIDLKEQNFKLVSERKNLVVRAAASFDELTPRPNIKKIITEKYLFLDEKHQEFIENIKKKTTTVEIFEYMLENLNISDSSAKKRTLERKGTREIKEYNSRRSRNDSRIKEIPKNKASLIGSFDKLPEMK